MKTRSGCARWIELVDREAVGEALAVADAGFVRSHAASCASCAAEAKAWSALARIDERVDETGVEADVESFLSSLPRTQKTAERSRWRSRAGVAAAGAVALAASVALWLRARPPEPSRIDLAVTSGTVQIDGRQATAGEALSVGATLKVANGSACFAMSGGAYACLADASEARVDDATPAHRRLALLHGKIAVATEPQTKASFSVFTAEGSITGAGASFVVETTPAGPSVRSLHGILAVALSAGVVEEVHPHETLAAGSRRASTEAEASADGAFLAPQAAWGSGASGTVELSTRPPGAAVSVDGVSLGASPVSAVLAAGHHVVLVGSGAATESFDLPAGARVSRVFDLAPPPPSPPPPPSSSSPPPDAPAVDTPRPSRSPRSATPARAPSPAVSADASVADVLGTARSLRADGRHADAAAVYRKLLSGHRNDPASRAALVPLGDLQLEHLGDAAGALASYRAYAKSGGPLALEARYGEIRALHKLGRSADEQRAIAAFLADYPSSAQADALRRRLDTLRTDEP